MQCVDPDLAQREGTAVPALRRGLDRLVAGLEQQQLGLVLRQHRRRRIDSGFDRMLAQDLQAEGVDRADHRVIEVAAMRRQRLPLRDGPADALAHLRGRRLRERHRGDLRDAAVLQQPEVALHEDEGLAAAGAGRDGHVRGRRLQDRGLFGRQLHCFHRLN